MGFRILGGVTWICHHEGDVKECLLTRSSFPTMSVLAEIRIRGWNPQIATSGGELNRHGLGGVPMLILTRYSTRSLTISTDRPPSRRSSECKGRSLLILAKSYPNTFGAAATTSQGSSARADNAVHNFAGAMFERGGRVGGLVASRINWLWLRGMGSHIFGYMYV